MENREDWKEVVKKRQNKMEVWRHSFLSVEELLCLQLLGYSSKQLYENMESERYSLKETASMSICELDKAKRILDRQIKAGVITIPYNAADKDGLDMAYELAKQMGEQGHIVISGLALGYDTVAHQGCLDVGGQTIAVVFSGLDITHPKVNKSLQDEIIAKGGAILSEHPFGWENNVYSVQYDTQNELNSGNKFLLDYNLALPIRLGQEITLDLDNKIVIA